jgi:hypothetical protein
MKRWQVSGWLVAALLASFVSSAVAQDTNASAYSSSAVGVIRKTLPANGKLALVSVPLDQETDEGAGFVFSNVPAISNLPNYSVAMFYDVTNQEWVTVAKSRNSWGTPGNRLVKPGESFFLKNVQSTNIPMVVSGEVPADASIGQVLAGGALTLVANPYPVAMAFSDFSCASTLPNYSVVMFWNEDDQSWDTVSKSRNSWDTQASRVIAPGEGFFVKPASSDITWTESRPYTWPN